MTYPDTPPRRKRIAEVQSDDPDKVWEGCCENCGDDENYPHFHVEEGPLTGPSVICKECIRLMTPHLLHSGRPAISRLRGQDRERPVAVVVKERDLEELRRNGYRPKKRRRRKSCNGQDAQLGFNLSGELPPGVPRLPTEKVEPANLKPNPGRSMRARIEKAKSQDVTSPPVTVEKPEQYYEEQLVDGLQCTQCLRLLRPVLDRAAVTDDETLCLNCFESRYTEMGERTTGAGFMFADEVWLKKHKLEKDWRIAYVDQFIPQEEQSHE